MREITNNLLKTIIFNRRHKLIETKKNLYLNVINEKEIYKYQCEKFNLVWQKSFSEIPFYKIWKEKHNLPNSIKSIEELKQFPVLTKKYIRENQKLIFSHLRGYNTISTGGSTGEPIKFPTSRKEANFSYANHYLARGWWGVKPLDSILFFWGHSHLFGSGFKGQINQYKRFFYDWIINTRRLNAYDVSFNTLEKYYKELKKSNPSVIIGYTGVIYKLTKYINENILDIGNKSNLKGVVVTSETVSNYDIELIEKVFKVPCIVEYGMAETGVISYSKGRTKNIKLFWDTFIGIKDKDNILNVTTINNRLFPLINYRTDDIVETDDQMSVLTISKIMGRKNDFVKIKVGEKFIESHSEFFTHVIKAIEGVVNFKIIQHRDLSILIEYVSTQKTDISSSFFGEVRKEYKYIDQKIFSFKQVDEIPKSIAGKDKWIEIEK